VEAPASAVELGKRLIEEAEEGRLLAADIHDNPVCTVNYDARIPAIVVVWKRYVTSLQLRFVHELVEPLRVTALAEPTFALAVPEPVAEKYA